MDSHPITSDLNGGTLRSGRDLELAFPKGFSLMELLVALAIIAILAAILIPAMSGVREQSDATKCASNLRGIGVGLSLYAIENDGKLPPLNSNNNHSWLMATWFPALLKEQLPDYRIWNCPGRDEHFHLRTNWRNGYGWYFGCYAYNSGLQGKQIATLESDGLNPIVMADGRGEFWDTAAGRSYLEAPHQELANCLYLDGHIEMVSKTDME